MSPSPMHHLTPPSRTDLRALRGELRRERRRIQSEAIALGPCPRLGRELDELERRERALAWAERRRRESRPGMWAMLTALVHPTPRA
jgi:hypothetical protein